MRRLHRIEFEEFLTERKARMAAQQNESHTPSTSVSSTSAAMASTTVTATAPPASMGGVEQQYYQHYHGQLMGNNNNGGGSVGIMPYPLHPAMATGAGNSSTAVGGPHGHHLPPHLAASYAYQMYYPYLQQQLQQQQRVAGGGAPTGAPPSAGGSPYPHPAMHPYYWHQQLYHHQPLPLGGGKFDGYNAAMYSDTAPSSMNGSSGTIGGPQPPQSADPGS